MVRVPAIRNREVAGSTPAWIEVGASELKNGTDFLALLGTQHLRWGSGIITSEGFPSLEETQKDVMVITTRGFKSS